MNTHFSSKLNKMITVIHPGEYFATGDDIYISTVLGSCISVALYDEKRNVGGMNHFMLPKPGKRGFETSSAGKYGIHAMELLINAMYKLGSSKKDFTAKVFGGGSVIASSSGSAASVPANNIEFISTFLETEAIPVTSSDVGGSRGRKIFFSPVSAKVLLRRLSGENLHAVSQQEKNYLERLKSSRDFSGSITLFSSDHTGPSKQGGQSRDTPGK